MDTQPSESSELYWYSIQTAIGTTIFRIDRSGFPLHPGEPQRIKAIDACSVVQRPTKLFIDQKSNVLYTPEEAHKKGYVVDGVELAEVDGDMVNDYIPMYPDDPPGTNVIDVNVANIIFIKKLGLRPDLTEYVNQKLGRTPYKVLESAPKDPTEQG